MTADCVPNLGLPKARATVATQTRVNSAVLHVNIISCTATWARPDLHVLHRQRAPVQLRAVGLLQRAHCILHAGKLHERIALLRGCATQQAARNKLTRGGRDWQGLGSRRARCSAGCPRSCGARLWLGCARGSCGSGSRGRVGRQKAICARLDLHAREAAEAREVAVDVALLPRRPEGAHTGGDTRVWAHVVRRPPAPTHMAATHMAATHAAPMPARQPQPHRDAAHVKVDHEQRARGPRVALAVRLGLLRPLHLPGQASRVPHGTGGSAVMGRRAHGSRPRERALCHREHAGRWCFTGAWERGRQELMTQGRGPASRTPRTLSFRRL